MGSILHYLALGLLGGVVSGLVGVGGGIVIVPALVFICGMEQHLAQGTTLAMLIPPIGILAAWTYWKQGFVDVKVALLMCVGFVLGGLIGAKIATALPTKMLEKVFAVAMLLVSLKMLIGK